MDEKTKIGNEAEALLLEAISEELYAMPVSECNEYELGVLRERAEAMSSEEIRKKIFGHKLGATIDEYLKDKKVA